MNRIRRIKVCKSRLVACLLTLLIFASGCAVLTPSQVKEVNKFAVAARNYGTLPGTVINSHADIRETEKMLMVSIKKDGDAALGQLEKILEYRKSYKAEADRADSALDILNDYAELLVKLTSDSYTNELQGSVENLSKSIDKGIKEYNEMYSKDFNLVGSSVALIVRGVGGVYIKSAQSKALKQAITDADPIVKDTTAAVESLLKLYTEDLMENARVDLERAYKMAVKVHGGLLPFRTVSVVGKELVSIDDTVLLANDAMKAAKAFREAHGALVSNVKQKQSLKGIIAQIQVLADEVKAARKLKKKLER
jgi:NADH dehydrogenase/NADH:ubiquinone oxidoreductase subunit G